MPAPKRTRPQSRAGLFVGVSACEENPPAGVAPIGWVLLTTLAEVDAALAVQLVDYYARRWRIERFHCVLKSGCGFEELQCDTLSALQKALSLYTIVSWRLLHLTYLARDAPDTSVDEVLSPVEKEMLLRVSGKEVCSAGEVRAVAKLGGWVSVPSGGPPGVKSIWLGFHTLQDRDAGFRLVCWRPPHRSFGTR